MGGLDRAQEQLNREFLAGELAGPAVDGSAVRLRICQLVRPAPRELGDDQDLLPPLAVLLPACGVQDSGQLIIA
ncbi:MAG TPA: hypothetical protein VHV09_04095 [Trebonia sp.]|nr:hypothetical protein [Trebonia sp.]